MDNLLSGYPLITATKEEKGYTSLFSIYYTQHTGKCIKR